MYICDIEISTHEIIITYLNILFIDLNIDKIEFKFWFKLSLNIDRI